MRTCSINNYLTLRKADRKTDKNEKEREKERVLKARRKGKYINV